MAALPTPATFHRSPRTPHAQARPYGTRHRRGHRRRREPGQEPGTRGCGRLQGRQHSDVEAVKKDAGKEYFDGSQSIAGYYAKVSQGAFTYVPAAEDEVVGPYELDLPQNPCDAGAVNKAAGPSTFRWARRLVVEYRHEDPSCTDDEDGNLNAASEGVHACRVPEGNDNSSRLIDPTPGQGKGKEDAITSLTDTANKVRVKVGRSGSGAATVSVSLGGVPAPADAGSSEQGNTAAPDPKAQGGEGAPASEKGTDADAPDDHAEKSGAGTGNLAETGGSSTTPLIAGTGVVLAAAGALCLYTFRRRGRRHA
ncbi:LAETG motif-containing sortase-dependent surface protein [Streptomyces sp. NPDC059818]|uniref:LAETG motif-containing sortase-dependent surface protein n=1 Tax=Streptomyces sp. NPDC059818 TaxID=3346962 RepID=UPI00365DCD9C